MRIYIPLDRRGGLAELARSGVVPLRRGYAVTPAFAQAYGSDDVEELEYAAMMAAAEASTDGHGRQVVVAADAGARPIEDPPGVVELGEPVPLVALASIHVGDEADGGLAWYAPQELEELVRQR